MNEDEVKKKTREWLEDQDFKVHSEVSVGEEREVVLDFYAYKENSNIPTITWIECKGNVNLSQLLEGFIRVEFAVFDRGGLGILAIPHEATQKLLRHGEFLNKSVSNLIRILDVEEEELKKL